MRSDGAHAGLGLAIVSELVHAHGGRVSVESTREAGTMFTVRLPRGGPAAEAARAAVGQTEGPDWGTPDEVSET